MGRKRFKEMELNGYVLRSGFEFRVGEVLNELGIPWTYETWSYSYETAVRNGHCKDCEGSNVVQLRYYTPDFFLWDGRVVLEVKGRFTGANRTTIRGVTRAQPDLDLRLVFQSNNVYSRTTKRRYSDWAEQYGIPYYAGLKHLKENLT